MSESKSNSCTSSRYRQFSVSSPDILHRIDKPLNEDNFKPNYDYLASLNEINQAKFSPQLPFKFGGSKFGKFKISQMFNSENVYSPNNESFHTGKENWINGVTRYFKPILNYINHKSPAKDLKEDDWEIPVNEIQNLTEIGRGNQGIVYVGMYRGNIVAVKHVKDKDEIDIKHLKRLQHPNIIKFLGVTTDPCYIVMEYCSKGQLYDALKKSDQVTRELVADWSKQIAKGMAYLHSEKIMHRDLKSLNVLINQENKLKICDFGNCKNVNELSAKMSFAGTVAWMSPEVIKNGKCSEKIDIWSFGVVFWELLFCERPYAGLEQQVIIVGVGINKLTLPIPDTCPPKYRNLMQQCFNIEPKKRPDFNQILADLKLANKELLSTYSEKTFIEMKRQWKDDINQSLKKFSTIKKFWSSSDEENSISEKREEDRYAQDIKVELEEKLQDVNKLLKNLEQREKRLRKIEKEYGIRMGYKSPSNGLINSLSRRLANNITINKTSSLKLGRFVRNRSRRSYRLHCAQKQFNKTSTRDAEIQTNFFDFDDESINNQNHTYKAIDSGYVTSCLSTPVVKHRLITTNFQNSNLANNSNFDIQSNHVRSSNDHQHHISTGFRLHPDHQTMHLGSNLNSELPGGYLEASFENKLMLKKGPNSYCEYQNNGKFSSTTEESQEETDDETQDISVDSLNNKYSGIFRPSSDSMSSVNSLSWETNQQILAKNSTKSKLVDTSIRQSSTSSNILKFDGCKRMAAINDENESDENSLTINSSYVVIPASKSNKCDQNYIVLQSPTKDQLSKKNVRDSLLLYKNKSFKKDELFM